MSAVGKREDKTESDGHEPGRPVPPPEPKDPKGGGKHEK